MELVCEFLDDFSFAPEDIDYLAGLTDGNNDPLFEDGFLQALNDLTLTCDMDAVPEGTPVFPNEPLLRVSGPVLQARFWKARYST